MRRKINDDFHLNDLFKIKLIVSLYPYHFSRTLPLRMVLNKISRGCKMVKGVTFFNPPPLAPSLGNF